MAVHEAPSSPASAETDTGANMSAPVNQATMKESKRGGLSVFLSIFFGCIAIFCIAWAIIRAQPEFFGLAFLTGVVSLSFVFILITRAAETPQGRQKKVIRILERLRSYLANDNSVLDE